MQPRQKSHSTEEGGRPTATNGKRKFAGKARLPGVKKRCQKANKSGPTPNLDPGTNKEAMPDLEEVVSSVAEKMLPEINRRIESIISQRLDTPSSSAEVNDEIIQTLSGDRVGRTLVIVPSTSAVLQFKTDHYNTRKGFNLACRTTTIEFEPVKQIQIKTQTHKSEVFVTAGQTSTISCTTDASAPPATIEWYRNEISVTSRFKNSKSICKKEATVNDYDITSGPGNITVMCKAWNIDGVILESNIVTVVFVAQPTSNPTITSALSVTSVKVHDFIILICSQKGRNPPPMLNWEGACAGKDSYESNTMAMVRSEILFHVEEQMSSIQCSCQSSNSHYPASSTKSTEITICVNYPVKQVQIKTATNKSEVFVSDGQTATILCSTDASFPPATIEWYRNGISVTSRSNYGSVSSCEKRVTVNEHSITSGHGNITVMCKAWNIEGAIVESSLVEVVFIAQPILKLIITTDPHVTTVEVHDLIILMCSQKGGNPVPRLKWEGVCAGRETYESYNEDVARSEIRINVAEKINLIQCRCHSSHPIYPVSSIKSAEVTIHVRSNEDLCKNFTLIGVAIGIGTTFVLCIILALMIWYIAKKRKESHLRRERTTYENPQNVTMRTDSDYAEIHLGEDSSQRDPENIYLTVH